jgi:hypothetical protein
MDLILHSLFKFMAERKVIVFVDLNSELELGLFFYAVIESLHNLFAQLVFLKEVL